VKKPGPWKDGVRKLGPGRYEVRCTAREKGTSKKIVDTTRKVDADSKLEAQNIRERLTKELVEEAGGNGNDWTVSRAIAEYLPTRRTGTFHVWVSHARKIEAAFGPRRLSTIKPGEVQRFIVDLPGLADATANSVRTLFGRLFVHARNQGRFEGTNPVRDTSPKKTPKTDEERLAELESPPRRALRPEEIQIYLAAFPLDMRAMVTIQLLLGCRFGEATALKWTDIKWDTGHVRVVRTQYKGKIGPTKADRTRWAGLGHIGLAVLKAHGERMAAEKWPGWETWVFPRPVYWDGVRRSHDLWNYETVRATVVRVQRDLGLDLKARTHVLRHTFITAGRAHDNDDLLRAIVGHTSRALTEGYTDQSVPVRARPVAEFQKLMEATLVGGGAPEDAVLAASTPPETGVNGVSSGGVADE
jgi:integrase